MEILLSNDFSIFIVGRNGLLKDFFIIGLSEKLQRLISNKYVNSISKNLEQFLTFSFNSDGTGVI